MSGFVTVIGLEVHVQLRTHSKLFSPAPVAALGEPNRRVHAIDLGLPGVLPRPNQAAVALAVRAALALDGQVQPVSRFARKNYFYPDLPKGYQISQYDEPFCRGGAVPLGDGRSCRLHHIHLEEDAGKLLHTPKGSLVDLNRAGVPLIEIVGEPDLRCATDAEAFLHHLKEILQFTGVSDCDMELGSLRCDANISLMPRGSSRYGTRVEIKNLNSFKMVGRALEYEERRQSAVLTSGGVVTAETRLWDEERQETRSMRSKETAADYRYFPDPDLPPLEVDAALLASARAMVGELPLARRARYRTQFGLPEHDVMALTQDRDAGDWFERLAEACGDPKLASNWVMAAVLPAAARLEGGLGALAVTPAALTGLLQQEARGAITQTAARAAFARMVTTGEPAAAAIAALGLARISDATVLEPLVAAAIAALPAAAAAVQRGTDKALDALLGHVMRATRGNADPAAVRAMLLRQLAR